MNHKATIETLINSIAIAMMSFAFMNLDNEFWWRSIIYIGLAMSLEWFKYYGRSKRIWR